MADPVYRARTVDLSWQEVDGAIVLLDERDWQYLQLRGSAAVLWPHLERGATAAELAGALVEHFGIDAALAADDVGGFLDDLRHRELVTDAA